MKKYFILFILFPLISMASSLKEYEAMIMIEHQAKVEAKLFVSTICPSLIRKSLSIPTGRQGVKYRKNNKGFFSNLKIKDRKWNEILENEKIQLNENYSLTLLLLKYLPTKETEVGAIFINSFFNGSFFGDKAGSEYNMQLGSFYFDHLINSEGFSEQINECSKHYDIDINLKNVRKNFIKADKAGALTSYAALLVGGGTLLLKGIQLVKSSPFIIQLSKTKGWKYTFKFLNYLFYGQLVYSIYNMAQDSMASSSIFKDSTEKYLNAPKDNNFYGQCNEDISPLNWSEIDTLAADLLESRELFLKNSKNKLLENDYIELLKMSLINKQRILELEEYHNNVIIDKVPCDFPTMNTIIDSNKKMLNFLVDSISSYEKYLKNRELEKT